jgi:hypothetical protein
MEREEFTIVGRDGERYHTDRATVDLLRAAQTYDHRPHGEHPAERRVQDLVFDHAYGAGRIVEGPVSAQAVEHDHAIDTASERSQGHRR